MVPFVKLPADFGALIPRRKLRSEVIDEEKAGKSFLVQNKRRHLVWQHRDDPMRAQRSKDAGF